MVLSAKVTKSINTAARFVIAITALFFIYKQITNPDNLLAFTKSLQTRIHDTNFIVLIAITLLLMPLNWGLEAYKWKMLINYAERVSIKQALMSVFSGITMSLFTPNRTGDLVGRLLTLKSAPPLKGAILTVTGSISQLITTLLFGMFALCFFVPGYLHIDTRFLLALHIAVVSGSVIIGSVLVMLYLRVSSISSIARYLIKPEWSKIRSYLRVIRRLKRSLLIKVLLISCLRYLIFSSQFYLMLSAFGAHIPWFAAFILISMTYFTMTAIPTIALVDLGIRGSVSIYFLSMYFQPGIAPVVSILAASTAIWMINLALPSVFGMLFIYRIKLIRKT